MNATAQCPVCGAGTVPDARYCPTCGNALASGSTANLAGGALFARVRGALVHEFDIAREIGRGGMAAVYLAHDLQLGRKVALKVMLPELAFADEMPQRFLAEARTAAILDHPNIVPIFRAGESDGVRFFAMRYIDGCSLEQLVRALGQVPIGLACYILAEVAGALDYAHDEGVIHRDVKPGNVMLDRRWGRAIVTDFGIARVADSEHLTRTGMAVGTPAYMSPEQCMGDQPGRASDQYALGIVAYQLLTGAVPYTGSAFVVQTAHLHEPPPSIRDARPDCPAELEATVLRMLQKQASHRWPRLSDAIPSLLRHTQRSDSENQADLCRIIPIVAPVDTSSSSTPASPLPNGSGAAPAAPRAGASEPFALPTYAPHSQTPSAAEAAEPASPEAVSQVATVRVMPDAPQLAVGERARLRALVADASGDELADCPIAWASSAPEVAAVGDDGEVRAVSAGNAWITATCGGQSGSTSVAVSAPVAAPPVVPPAVAAEASPLAGVDPMRDAAPIAGRPTLHTPLGAAAIAHDAADFDLDVARADVDGEDPDAPLEPTIGQKLGITPSRPAPAPVPERVDTSGRSRSRPWAALGGVATVAIIGAVFAFSASDPGPTEIDSTAFIRDTTRARDAVVPATPVVGAESGTVAALTETTTVVAPPVEEPAPPPVAPGRVGKRIVLPREARPGGVFLVGDSFVPYVKIDSGRGERNVSPRLVGSWRSSNPAVLAYQGGALVARQAGTVRVTARVDGQPVTRDFRVEAAPQTVAPPIVSESPPGGERGPTLSASDTALARAAVDDFVGRLQRSPDQALRVGGVSADRADLHRALLAWANAGGKLRVQRRGRPALSADQRPPSVHFTVRLIRPQGVMRAELRVVAELRADLVHAGGGTWRLDNIVMLKPHYEETAR